MLELIKLIAAFLSGGLAGALITEWFRRRREKVQRIQLIERVNRLISPLEGFTLVRVIEGRDGAVKEVRDLREYQLTMRNSTSTHLQNAEVQFEFPSDDVQALVSIPALSRIALEPLDAPKTLGKKVFRWKVPHFPAGDSVEFTFRAVAPSSEKYECSLNYVGVIFERIVGEPPPARSRSFLTSFPAVMLMAVIAALSIVEVLQVTGALQPRSGEKLTLVKLGGCDLQVVSLFELYGQNPDSPWHIKHRIINVGPQDCMVQSQAFNLENPAIVKTGDTLEREHLSEHAPKLGDAVLSVGVVGNSRETATTPIYFGH
jgi:hypothetical protein